MSTGTSQPRLGPAWRSASQGGRGFQPPADHSETGVEGEGSTKKQPNRNSFSLLDMDDEGGGGSGSGSAPSSKAGSASAGIGMSSTNPSRSAASPKRGTYTSRSEGLRSAGMGSGGFGSRNKGSSSSGGGLKAKSGGGGRSLADLASRFPNSNGERHERHGHTSHSTHSHSHRRSSNGFDDTEGRPGAMMNNSSSHERGSSSRLREFVDDKSVIRFTREKLLSMRPRTDPSLSHPSSLNAIDGLPLLSNAPLDPVCWDNFDAEEIWNLSRERRTTKAQAVAPHVERRGSQLGGKAGAMPPAVNIGGGNRWQRGVALPPDQRRSGGGGGRYDDNADHPDELWDDPGVNTGAAADFSAFGGSLDDDPMSGNAGSGAGGDAFDLAAMAEQTSAFDGDFHNTHSGSNGVGGGSGASAASGSDGDVPNDHNVNPTRPLADAGTTIRSGSGDNVNVFEDFEAPGITAAKAAAAAKAAVESGGDGQAIKAGASDGQSASSRLMQMIGVGGEGADSSNSNVNIGGVENGIGVESKPNVDENATAPSSDNIFGAGFVSAVSSNPWGAAPEPAASSSGLDLAEKLREEQEEEKRRAALAAQQAQHQAELQRQAALQKQAQQAQQQKQEYSQVELVLAERISTILENNWGRSDLMTILQTLHNDDARVAPLLGSVDALRALIVRHPIRFALTKDQTFGADMAVLVMNNAQWQQQQQQQQNEDLQIQQRRQQEEHQQMLMAKQQEAEARAKAEAEARAKADSESIVITNDPWYYADPQGNIQGPFGGDEMRQWLEAGYFKGDLPISQSQSGPFRELNRCFHDSSVAFKPTGPSEEEKAKQLAELQAKAAQEEAALAAAKANNAAREAAEREAEANRQAELQSNQNQSAQLKMLLGLGSTSTEPAAVGEGQKVEEPIITEGKIDVNEDEDEANVHTEPVPQSKPSKSKAKKQAETKVEKNITSAAPVPAPAPAAWGGAGTAKKTVSKKSMSEIQKEEARVMSQQMSQQMGSNAQGPGGWANIAASGGTTAWTGASVRAAPSAPAMSSSGSANTKHRMSKSMALSSGQKSNSQNTVDEFGAASKMTPALESWCKEQMKKLNGSEDLTLVAFCMTLTDPVEIKQYLTAYLGSSPQVNNFASEFIHHKNGTKPQEQWETTSSSKKGRKKKGASGK